MAETTDQNVVVTAMAGGMGGARLAFDSAEIARSIVFALGQQPHVQIAVMMILPVNRY